MSSLYRCRARVGYRPFKSDKLIVFDERQVQELTVDLKWQPGLGNLNQDNSTTPGASTNALNQSKCAVTISDPYLTGIAWPVLYDAASIYTASNVAAANNIILPACGEGQDPIADKCFKYVDLETDTTTSDGGDFAFLLISLWYEVAGTSFGTDFYFRVDGFSIAHGIDYPRVTIRGVEARSILFNQSLVNMTFDEGAEIEKVLKDIAEQSGYSVSFCLNTNEDPYKKRLLPRSIRFKGITPDEAIQKILDSVGGTSTSLPTKEYANKISMCARGELSNRTCSVFYLGKGLYEGYDINGQPELSLLGKNQELAGNRNNGDPYRSEAFSAQTYVIQDITPQRRQRAMTGVRKIAFPQLFDPVTPHIKDATRVTSGFVWKDSKPAQGLTGGKVAVINEKVKDTILYGIAPTGTTAISFLKGDVKEADAGLGRVVINTKFGLRVCKPEDDKKCFHRQIKQESTGLNTVSVKNGDKVEINQPIGTSTADKPEFTRFFIDGYGGEQVTLNPQLVWDWAIPEEELKDANPASAPVTATPQQAQQPPPTSQQDNSGFIGRIGDTGRSRGAHLHAEWENKRPITEADVRKYIRFGKPVVLTSAYGPRSSGNHRGVDLAAPGDSTGVPMYIQGGASVINAQTGCKLGDARCGGGFGNNVLISTPEGNMILAHLQEGTIPPNIAGLRSSSGGGKAQPHIQAAPATQGLTVETSFNGVPRSLRIIPGQTILSFISDYDAWVENNGPRGGDNARDPGVWIPQRFANWFITQCGYKWREGNLRVNLEARSAWGTGTVSVPTFGDYLSGMKKAGDIKNTSDYFGYIRSIGDLNWKVEAGGKLKDSTEEFCAEAQYWAQNAGSTPGSSSTTPSAPGSVESVYPTAKCQYTGTKYPADRVNAIINAARAGGINTKAGFAGVVGNALAESTTALSPTAENPNSKAYGIFQWLGVRRRGLESHASGVGKSASDFNTQMSWFVKELKGADFQGPATVSSLNRQTDPSQAALEFNRLFERAPGQNDIGRQQFAREIFNGLSCS